MVISAQNATADVEHGPRIVEVTGIFLVCEKESSKITMSWRTISTEVREREILRVARVLFVQPNVAENANVPSAKRSRTDCRLQTVANRRHATHWLLACNPLYEQHHKPLPIGAQVSHTPN